ncbi:glycoside-pentoside-hexuronide (GPH):cation symporter [Dongshaea marina]|uniref:glycoside-pentoside-hexuronide (GPH):cation symporter n=1 Tax=Dongshaea marina TaxID=2047966 RepID=UPI000D3ED3E8|nr:glycoside-pentoside-hexuronide (GPH):cation symporter [Dongshaea marina]
MYDLGQIYLLKFYTDSLGLHPAAAGGVFFFTKIFDAFTDFSVGTWVDKRRRLGKRGKFRPFILFGAIPLGLATVASFYNPGLSVTGNLVWAYLTYMLFGLIYSIVNIPYGSMIPAMTQDPVERAQLSAFRQGGSNLALLITTVLFVPLTSMMPTSSEGAMIVVSIFALSGVLLQLWCYANVREHNVVIEKVQPQVEFKKAFSALLGNTPLLLLCLASLFTFSAFNVKLVVQVYYLQYVLKDISLLPYMGFFSIGCVFLGVACVPWLSKTYGKKLTFMLGCAIWATGDLVNYFFIHNHFGFIFFSCVAFFGSALINSLSWAIASDAVEYGQWRSGMRTEGMVYSFFIFSRKLSQSIAGLVPGVVLAFVGYVPNVLQTAETLVGIKLLMFVYPGVLALITLLIWHYGYRLDEDRYEQILCELRSTS